MVEEVLSGYCYVGKQNIECFFTLFDYRVTLIVKDKDDLIGLRKWGQTESIEEFIYGVTSQGKKIIFIRNGTAGFHMGFPNGSYEVSFYTRYFLIGDIEENISRKTFYGLQFYGEAVDDVILKIVSTDINDAKDTIKINKPSNYIDKYNIDIEGIIFEVHIGVNIGISRSIKNGIDFNNKYSYIKMIFQYPQELKDYWKFHQYVSNLLAFCLGCKDIRFKVKMLDFIDIPIHKNKDKSLVPVMDYNFCWYSDSYKEVSNIHNVILLKRIDRYFSNIFEILNSKKLMPVLDFLPDNSDMKHKIKSTDVGLICAALEREFSFYKCENNNIIIRCNEAKALARKLKYEVNHFNTSDENKEKAYQLISCLSNFTFSLTEKVLFLMSMFEDIVRKIAHKNCKLPSDVFTSAFKDIDTFKVKFKYFQRMRNTGSHGLFVWDDSFEIYNYLVILVYASILYRSGYRDNEIIEVLGSFFGYQL